MKNKTKIIKKFNTVKFQREVKANINEDIMNMTAEEILEYLKRKNSKEKKQPSDK